MFKLRNPFRNNEKGEEIYWTLRLLGDEKRAFKVREALSDADKADYDEYLSGRDNREIAKNTLYVGSGLAALAVVVSYFSPEDIDDEEEEDEEDEL